MPEFQSYDLIIVGAGPVGLTASMFAQKFGIDHLLVEKCKFPRDKICGDGLSPLVFRILDELDIDVKSSGQFHWINQIEFQLSENRVPYFQELSTMSKSGTYNCRRELFDDFLKNAGGVDDFMKYALVTEVDMENNTISIDSSQSQEKVRFKNLLICTGSGKDIIQGNNGKQGSGIAIATRAYVKVDQAGRKSFFEYFEEVAPGYFWAFPVAENLLNTGIYFHDRRLNSKIYDLHREKIGQHLQVNKPIEFKRFPLRIYPNPSEVSLPENIALAGDANHTINPLFGHGIDSGMLEVREQLISLHKSDHFTQNSLILEKIRKHNELSLSFKNELELSTSHERKMELFQDFLTETNKFYQVVNTHLDKAH